MITERDKPLAVEKAELIVKENRNFWRLVSTVNYPEERFGYRLSRFAIKGFPKLATFALIVSLGMSASMMKVGDYLYESDQARIANFNSLSRTLHCAERFAHNVYNRCAQDSIQIKVGTNITPSTTPTPRLLPTVVPTMGARPLF